MAEPKAAVYGLNDWLKTLIPAAGITGATWYPGRFAAESAGDFAIVYSIYPSTGTEFYMVHNDRIVYRIYHTSFDTLQSVMHVFLKNLNVENLWNVTALSESGIRYMDAHATVTDTEENVFVEGNNYYYCCVEVQLCYTLV